MRVFNISATDNNQRLNRFLEKTVPGLYPSLMYKYLRTKHIKVNGKRATGDIRLKEGDIISLYISDDFFDQQRATEDFMNASDDISILYEDKNILIINKPVGLISHSDSTKDMDTLVNRLLKYLTLKSEFDLNETISFTPALCNRLDKNTEGIVIAAKNLPSLQEMNLMIKQRDVKKYYLTVVTSTPPPDGIYSAYHQTTTGNRVLISDSQVNSSKEIFTGIKTVYSNNGFFIVQIELITGRKHQIRAHLSHLGCPILGDPIYGDMKINLKLNLSHQLLISYMMSFFLKEHLSNYPLLSYLDEKTYIIGDSESKLKAIIDTN